MKKIGVIENSEFFPRGLREVHSAAEAMRVSGGNTGNVAFVHGLRTMITDEQIYVNWGTSAESMNAGLDALIICCANQLGAHVDLGSWAERLHNLEIPVLLVGLGAQSVSYEIAPLLPQGTLDFLQQVKRLSGGIAAIATRGDFTTGLLRQLDVSSISTGCPSVLISSDLKLGETILEKKLRTESSIITVCGGNPWHESSAIEPSLVDLMNRHGGTYILQHPQLAFDYFFDEIEKVSDIGHGAMSHLLFGEPRDPQTIKKWIKNNAKFFLDAHEWMDFLRSSDLVIGARYHGVALGIQIGCPGTVFSIDSRTRELCEQTGVPHIDYRRLVDTTSGDLLELVSWNEQKALMLDSARKKNAHAYLDFFTAHGLAVAPHIQAIAG